MSSVTRIWPSQPAPADIDAKTGRDRNLGKVVHGARHVYPITGKSLLPLHHHCLFKLGLPLAELWYLRDLAEWLHAHQRHRFLLTAPPLRLPGAVGSPVTPIATV